jgi:DNA-binding NarL/FixJ family response regulator
MRKSIYLLFVALTLSANLVYIVLDINSDFAEKASLAHMIPEIFCVVLSAAMILYSALQLKIQISARRILSTRLAASRSETVVWREKTEQLAKGLSDSIDLQFESWQLSKAEKEISLLILKGFANKEIAALRNTTEQTVKQQASNVYRKSGLGSRHQFSAFFLEDILAPRNNDDPTLVVLNHIKSNRVDFGEVALQ